MKKSIDIFNNPDNYTGVVTNKGDHIVIGKDQRLQITKGRVQIWQYRKNYLLHLVVQFNKRALIWLTKEENDALIHEPVI